LPWSIWSISIGHTRSASTSPSYGRKRFHLWQQHPKGYRFTAAEATVQAANAEEHMAPDILSDMLVRVFEIDPTQQEWRETSSSILEKLRTFAGLSRSNDAVLGKEIARTLKQQWGITGKRSNGAHGLHRAAAATQVSRNRVKQCSKCSKCSRAQKKCVSLFHDCTV
jgi:hypothetical protein